MLLAILYLVGATSRRRADDLRRPPALRRRPDATEQGWLFAAFALAFA
jgi:hypothetical protein